MDGMTISIYPDYTARVARARAGYNGVRQQLRGVEGVRYGILYPALRITHNNQERIFSTPEEAQSYIRENISANSRAVSPFGWRYGSELSTTTQQGRLDAVD
ncbi:hypothetical protein MHYP_G00088680 [Metynnis hypsauchen]